MDDGLDRRNCFLPLAELTHVVCRPTLCAMHTRAMEHRWSGEWRPKALQVNLIPNPVLMPKTTPSVWLDAEIEVSVLRSPIDCAANSSHAHF